MSKPPPWTVDIFADRAGRCPVWDFIRAQGDAKIRAKIVRKMEHVAKMQFDDLRRPLVDTLDAPVKELVVDKQIRVLFTCHLEEGVMVMLEADRKKNGHVDEEVVRRALENHEEWLATRRGYGIDQIKQAMGMKE